MKATNLASTAPPKSSGVMRFWIWTSVLSTASFPPGSRASGCGSAMEGAANLERASSPNSNCFDFKRVVQNTPTCAGVEYVSLIWLCGTDSYALSSSSPLNRLILFYSMHHSFFISLISRSCSSMARIESATTLQSIEFSFRKAGLRPCLEPNFFLKFLSYQKESYYFIVLNKIYL